MSYDIRFGLNKTYNIPVKVDTQYKVIVNPEAPVQSKISLEMEVTKRTLKGPDDQFISSYVMAEHTDNEGVKDRTVPTDKSRWYLIKSGSTYSYSKTKPFEYESISYSMFKSIINKDIRTLTEKDITSKAIKATRALVQSQVALNSNSDMVFSFPFGGICKATPRLYYISNFIIKELLEGPSVKLDLLEGMVYINQNFPDYIDQVFGYFDIEPLNISKSPYLTISGNTESTYSQIIQKSIFGDITVKEISDGFIITFSKNSFISSSSPYFITVDGVNLLNPRYIPKNTPILVQQRFSKKKEGSLESYLKLFNGVESREVSNMATFIKNTSSTNLETFLEASSASGLFIYKEVGEGSFDTINSTYLPLFKSQTIIREQE